MEGLDHFNVHFVCAHDGQKRSKLAKWATIFETKIGIEIPSVRSSEACEVLSMKVV